MHMRISSSKVKLHRGCTDMGYRGYFTFLAVVSVASTLQIASLTISSVMSIYVESRNSEPIANESSHDLGNQTSVLLSPNAYNTIAIYLAIITIAGVALNASVIIIFLQDKQLRTPFNFVLVNLAGSDLCIAAFGGTISVEASLHRGWNLGPALCVGYAFAMSLAGIVSITTLSSLALWRCAVVVFPLKKTGLNHRSTACIILTIWAYSFAVTVPPIFGWGRYGPEAAKISCSVEWEVQEHNSRSFIIYLFVTGLFLPVMIMTASYGCMLRAIHRSRHQITRRKSRHKEQRRFTLMVAVMISAFLIAWIPYSVFSWMHTFAGDSGPILNPLIATIPSLFAKSSIIFNPLIYCGLNTQFRAAWKRLLGRRMAAGLARKDNTMCYRNRAATPMTTVGLPDTQNVQGPAVSLEDASRNCTQPATPTRCNETIHLEDEAMAIVFFEEEKVGYQTLFVKNTGPDEML